MYLGSFKHFKKYCFMKILQRIPERPVKLGLVNVGRILPFREKRSVGPFVFLDRMGPAILTPERSLDVLPHPHIGLSTLTYLFEGSILHRDSTGAVMEIKPGEVNWMTAGKGVVHSERTPAHLRQSDSPLHGLQFWVGLPLELEQCDPSFSHTGADGLPEWTENGLHYRLVAGKACGFESQVPVHSPLFFLDIIAGEGGMADLRGKLYGEAAVYVVEGSMEVNGETAGTGELLVAEDSGNVAFYVSKGSRIIVLGGMPFPEPRFIEWNFVHSDREVIAQAKADWVARRFPEVPGETEFVPLP